MSTLREVVELLSPEPLRALVAEHPKRAVSEVVLYDAADRGGLTADQLVLGVGVAPDSPEARRMLRDVGDADACAVVVKCDPDNPPDELIELARGVGVALLAVRPGFDWASLFSLLRSAGADAEPESAAHLVPGDLDGVAGAVEAMVGGSVVIYDRGHRVLAYSASRDDVDAVRRQTILHRRTPEDWVRRFTLDDSAYRTVRMPGEVIRVDNYEGLRTRLRVAVCAGEEILGEISVAEGSRVLDERAEQALKRAAMLTVPHLLSHRAAQLSARTARWTMLRAVVDGTGPLELYATQLGLDPSASYTVVAISARTVVDESQGAHDTWIERVLHFVSLHLSDFNARSMLLFDGAYIALVPTPTSESRGRLIALVTSIVRELDDAGAAAAASAAVSERAEGLDAVPASRRQAARLLALADGEPSGTVLTPEERWQPLAVDEILTSTRGAHIEPCVPLKRLIEHDEKHQSNYTATLRAYLDAFGSISAAATRLVVHPNTLRHRMQRLAEISGLTLTDPDERTVLDIHLRLLELSDHPPRLGLPAAQAAAAPAWATATGTKSATNS